MKEKSETPGKSATLGSLILYALSAILFLAAIYLMAGLPLTIYG